ncbi:MAG: flagellar hook protein [Planctomycetota bacterium]
MALLPVATNRVSAPLNNQRLLFQLNNDQLAIQRQYDQLSTGRRVLRLSDDPAAASRATNLQRGISRTDQLVRNANATEAYHQSTDVALDRVNSALINARGAAVGAAQNVIGDDEREAYAAEVRQLLESVVSAGNSMFNDHQLLGGILQPESALEPDRDTVVFNGTTAIGQTKVGFGSATPLTVSGDEALGVAGVFLEGNSLNAVLNEQTRLVDMRAGIGVRPGIISISDGDNHVQLDLSNAATIGDIVDVLRDVKLDDRELNVQFTGDAISIQYADGLPGTIAISDLPGDQLAADLQISNPDGFRTPPIVGDRLAPQVTTGTSVADLSGGAGIDLASGIVIDRGDERHVIDISDAETVGDVLIAINRSGAQVQAELDQAQGRINLRGLVSGVDYSIGENGGSTASDLGIRSATTATLFDQLNRDRGVSLSPDGPDLVITKSDGVEIDLELSGVRTIDEFIALVDSHPNNVTGRITVALNSVGNGLEISGPPGPNPIRVTQPGVSDVGVHLGFIEPGESVAEGVTDGSFAVLRGRDYRPLEPGGAIDTLLRLEAAIRDADIVEIGRLQDRLDDDLDRSSRTRGRVGTWNATVRDLKDAIQDENTLLESQLSDALDADLATVISELQARQAAMEASLRFIGQTAGLTVLNFL